MNYIETTIAAALSMSKGDLIRVSGVVSQISNITNTSGKTQQFINFFDGDYAGRLIVYEDHADKCSLVAVGDRIHAYGKWDRVRPINELSMIVHRIEADKSAAPVEVEYVPALVSGKYDSWNGLTEAEVLFLQTEDVPPEQFVLSQVAVGQYRVDFVFYRKADKSPVIAVEIDGDTHVGRRTMDAQRTSVIEKILGCNVVRIDAARIYSDARKKGIVK